jgi:hypothetical protein
MDEKDREDRLDREGHDEPHLDARHGKDPRSKTKKAVHRTARLLSSAGLLSLMEPPADR